MPHYHAPDDPHALYAEPAKIKRQSSQYVRRPEEARAVIENTPRPSYPAPPLPEEISRPGTPAPPPAPPPPPGPQRATYGLPPPEQRMTIQEEMDQIRQARRSLPSASEGEETYARQGKSLTSDAFRFLDEYI